jgi:peptidyl-prolyl cis-trans isomerase SurA
MPLSRIKRNFRPLVEETLLIERIRRQKLQSVKVSRSDVVTFWEQIKDSLPPLQDGVRLAHILLQDKVSEASTQAAISKADSARKLLESGSITLEEYASRYSDDPGSATRAGKLGTTNRGDLVPEYEAAAYAMEPGAISQPVVSQFGVHLIRLEDRTGEKITTSHILFAIVPAAADQQSTQSLADSLVSVLRAGGNFSELTRTFSIDTKTAAAGGDLGWFSPQELPDDFRAPVEGLKKGDYTEPFRTRFGVHIIKISDRVYSRKITLDEDFSRIEQMALAKKQDDEFRKWVDQLRAETYVEKK